MLQTLKCKDKQPSKALTLSMCTPGTHSLVSRRGVDSSWHDVGHGHRHGQGGVAGYELPELALQRAS